MMHTKHISTYILAAATSMLSLFAVLPCQAQSKKKIIEQQPDTIPFFRGMAVGVEDQRSLFQIRCRLESSEEQTRRLPSVWRFPLCLHLL